MQTKQSTMLVSLENVQGFLNDNAATLGGVVATGTRRELDQSIAELAAHVDTQNDHTRGQVSALARQREKRAALLRDHMTPIARIARLRLADKPELRSLALPTGRPSVRRLAGVATGMATAASRYTEVFVDAGLKPTFATDLRNAAADMLRAMQDRTLSRSKVRTSTSALRNTLARGRKVVQVLDAFVSSALVNDPDLLAGWKQVKRLGHARTGVSAAVIPAATPGTAPAGTLTVSDGGHPAAIAPPVPTTVVAAA